MADGYLSRRTIWLLYSEFALRLLMVLTAGEGRSHLRRQVREWRIEGEYRSPSPSSACVCKVTTGDYGEKPPEIGSERCQLDYFDHPAESVSTCRGAPRPGLRIALQPEQERRAAEPVYTTRQTCP